MACCCVAQIISRVKGHHVYDYKYTVNDELICLRDDKNIHSDNAIAVLSKVEEKKKKGCIVKPVEKLVGHVPEALAKIL